MNEEPKNQIKDLSKIQRRVLGVLMEKAFTTPDQYPLTLKATTTGCNQKSNRSPLVGYDEGQVQDALDAMRLDLLVAEVFPGGGRTPRYRHYARHKFDFSEAQFAIIAELLLRGRQQPGELRTRASRMVRIESQDQLRQELSGLQKMGYLQSNGPLDRRGVEVDHTFYLAKEGMNLSDDSGGAAAQVHQNGGEDVAEPAVSQPAPESASHGLVNEASEKLLDELRTTIQEQDQTMRNLESLVSDLGDRLEKIERDLGL